MLRGRKILLGITGGIAAYKAPLLVRELRKNGADVRVVMTPNAREFVAPTTLSALSGHEVIADIFPPAPAGEGRGEIWHVDLARWADLMLIAPATANSIAKLAHGYADTPVTTVALALRSPLLISPAMDVDMWQHPATQSNISALRALGYTVIPPEKGALASGLVGAGRLPEVRRLIKAIAGALGTRRKDLSGRRILVTAGPTHEAIDPVRYIANRSSGKMGFAIARAAAERGAAVTLVAGSVQLVAPAAARRIDVESAEEMYAAVMKHAGKMDAVIMAAAVADFAPAAPSPQKIKKERLAGAEMTLPLKKTKDILRSLGERKNGCVTVGFALETSGGIAQARKKLRDKHADIIVLNGPGSLGGEFTTVTILRASGRTERLGTMPKFDAANKILDHLVSIF